MTVDDKNGFTLIEVVVVLVIISILAAVAATRVGDIITTSENSSDLDTLRSHLRYAQIRALNTQGVWGVDFAGNTYHLYSYISGASTVHSFPGEDNANVDKPSAVTYAGYVSFDEWGRPYGDEAGTTSLSATPAGFDTIVITPETGYIP